MQHDPIADMLTIVRNAALAGKRSVRVPYSRLKHTIAQKLFQAGYLAGVDLAERGAKKEIVVLLKYEKRRDPYARPKSAIHGLERVSKTSRRVYSGARAIGKPRRGIGTYLLTTPKGVLLAEEARREGVGGEVLVAVW
ncbi:30S ribosomal protein S8 [Candidatus Parcubacteria bacterium]|nr:MAG: 30S ribosomal protein S8 [Candidatus Parcubacteria bacterium]